MKNSDERALLWTKFAGFKMELHAECGMLPGWQLRPHLYTGAHIGRDRGQLDLVLMEYYRHWPLHVLIELSFRSL